MQLGARNEVFYATMIRAMMGYLKTVRNANGSIALPIDVEELVGRRVRSLAIRRFETRVFIEFTAG